MRRLLVGWLLCLLVLSAQSWAPAQLTAAPTAPTAPLIHGARIRVAQPGLHRIALQSLQNAAPGNNWLGDPEATRFFQGTRELPRLHHNDEFLVFVPPFSTLWDRQGALTARHTPGTAGLTPQTRAVAPPTTTPLTTYTQTLRIEEQALYSSFDPRGEDQDHWWGWFWYTTGGPAAPITITFDLPASAQLNAPGALKLRLHGSAYGFTHSLDIALNGVTLGNATWPGRNPHEPTFAVPAGVYQATNTLVIQSTVTTNEGGLMDWVDVRYQRPAMPSDGRLSFDGPGGSYAISAAATTPPPHLWDTSDPYSPQVLTGWTQDQQALRWSDPAPRSYALSLPQGLLNPLSVTGWTAPDLRQPDLGADYLAISYDTANGAWRSALQPLLDWRSAQGMRTSALDVQWIYDQFGDGRVDPRAIQAFLAFAHAEWPKPAPRYVLLVGDGTYDPHGYALGGSQQPNFLPPFISWVDPWIGATAADNRYVTFDGGQLPQMHLGRIPARNPVHISTVVAKTISYEQTASSSAWLRHVALVADKPDTGPGGAGDFHAFSESLRATLPASITATPLYYTGADIATMRANIVQTINGGALITNYIGHAGINAWGSGRLYGAPEIAQLTNNERLTIMVPMTCYTGYFQDELVLSLAEQELLHSGGGAVASWAPSGLGVAHGHDILNQALFQALFTDEVRRLGPATTMAKEAVAAAGPLAPDLIQTYTLFGDPALRIPLPANPGQARPDAITIERSSPPITIDVLANDTTSAGAHIVAVSAPSHGSLAINPDSSSLTYRPDPRYPGTYTVTYTITDLGNDSSAQAQLTITVLPTGNLVYVPVIRR